MPIDTVFLDAGGVLVFPNWTRVSRALSSHGVGVSAAALGAAEPYVKRKIDVAATIGSTDDKGLGWLYFDLILQHLGIPASAATAAALDELYRYHQVSNLWEDVPPGVEPALADLRDLGLRLVVVSNANGRLAHLFDRIGLSKYFDCLLDSSNEGVEKPDPRLFQIALERSGARAETTVHVGDLYYVDVMGARAAGLSAILLDVAGLYPEADCPRARSMTDVVKILGDFSARVIRLRPDSRS
jgi:putative hydrolase of the HAD superfamily